MLLNAASPRAQYLIYQSDVGTDGYNIWQAGVYQMAEDIVFDPQDPVGMARIQIEAARGCGANATALVHRGTIQSIFVNHGGYGYPNSPNVIICDPTGQGATAVAYVNASGGILSIQLIHGGNCFYTAPTIEIKGSAGTGATATVSTDHRGKITGFIVTCPGTDYPHPTVTIQGSGTGASILGTAVLDGMIRDIALRDGGTGYPETVRTAITIRHSNVTLLMNDKRLRQKGMNYQGDVSLTQRPFVTGIHIADALQNGLESIYVEGDQAQINGFSYCGIRIDGKAHDIRLSHLTVKNCAALLQKSIRPAIYSSAAVHLSSFGGIMIGGNDVFDSNTNVGRGIVLDNVSCLHNYATGLRIHNAVDLRIANCHVDDTFRDDMAGTTVGAALVDCQIVTMSQSTINNTTHTGDYESSGGGVTALRIRGVHRATFENVQVRGTSCTSVDNVTAVYVQGDEFILRNCSFDGTQSIQNMAVCVIRTSGHFKMYNCTVHQSTQNGQLRKHAPRIAGRMRGISVKYTGNMTVGDAGCRLENCEVQNLICNGPCNTQATVAAYDLSVDHSDTRRLILNLLKHKICTDVIQLIAPYLTSPVQHTELHGCTATRILALNGGSVKGFLFEDEGSHSNKMLNVLVDNCVATECETFVTTDGSHGTAQGFQYRRIPGPGTAAGIHMSYMYCKAIRNQGAVECTNECVDSEMKTYSAGFCSSGFQSPALSHTYRYCLSEENVYGFLIQHCKEFVIRECRADNNKSKIDGTKGGGFIDVGELTSANTQQSPGLSNSSIERNSTFNNGNGRTHNGLNGNYHVLTEVQINRVSLSTGTFIFTDAVDGLNSNNSAII